MVQDCLSEDFDHAAHHRDKIQQELADIQQLLKQIGEGTESKQQGNHTINTADRRKGARGRMTVSPGDTAATRNIPYQP
jgi:hypothetical protein